MAVVVMVEEYEFHYAHSILLKTLAYSMHVYTSKNSRLQDWRHISDLFHTSRLCVHMQILRGQLSPTWKLTSNWEAELRI